MEEYLLIDGNNLAHRAHNVNFELKTSEGIASGMFYGFVRVLMALKKKYRHFNIIVVWDGHAKDKYELQPDYKAGRTKLPSSIWAQISDIKQYLQSVGVVQYLSKDHEADDVIATLAERLKQEGKVYIYSNDKDLLQLVEDGKVIVYKPKVGLSPEKFYDEEAVKEQFGVPPKYLAHFRSFDGDSSDNIKGVSRVPRKIIATALIKYQSVDKVYDNLDGLKLTAFQRSSLDEAKERVTKNLKLIVLNRKIAGLDPTEATFDQDTVEALLGKYEVRSIKAADVLGLFSSTLSKKFTDPAPAYKLESYSLFG